MVQSRILVVPVWEDSRRVYTTLMGGFETLFLQRMAEQPLAEVSLAASVPNASELEVNATTRFPVNSENADCRLAVVVTEDRTPEARLFPVQCLQRKQ